MKVFLAIIPLLALINNSAFASCRTDYSPTQLVCQNWVDGKAGSDQTLSSLTYDVVGKTDHSLLRVHWTADKTNAVSNRTSSYTIQEAGVSVKVIQNGLEENDHTEIKVSPIDNDKDVLASASGFIIRYTGGMETPTKSSSTININVRTPTGKYLFIQCAQEHASVQSCI